MNSRPEHTTFLLLDLVPVGTFVLSPDFTVIYWNRCLEDWTGIRRGHIVGKNILQVFPHLQAPRYANRIQGIFSGGPATIFSSQLHPHFLPCPLPGGKFRVEYTFVTPVPIEGGGFNAMVCIQDVTALTKAIESYRLEHEGLLVEMEERKKAEETLQQYADELQRLNGELAELAVRDGLTGLYNHRHFYEMLRRDFLLAERHGIELACILVDLDFFKNVNDSYGHVFGDRVLKTIARKIGETVRGTDVVGRYGGEEFGILLSNTSAEGAFTLAEMIRQNIENTVHKFQRKSITITASLGVAGFPTHRPSSPQQLVEMADKALYAAKAAGRNTVRIHDQNRRCDAKHS